MLLKLITEFKVGILVVFLLFFANMQLTSKWFWDLPYKNSRSHSHEGVKLEKMYNMKEVPEIIALGSSWGEFGIDEDVISSRVKKSAFNMSVISTQIMEHAALYNEYKRYFGRSPEVTILVFDYTHIPMRMDFPILKRLSPYLVPSLYDGSVKQWIERNIMKNNFIYIFRNDIKIALLGFLTKDKIYLQRGVNSGDPRQENIDVWMGLKRWLTMKEFGKESGFHRQFTSLQIKELNVFLKRNFSGTKLIVVNGPLAFKTYSNFYDLFSKEVEDESYIQYFDYNNQISLDPLKHFYDKDHLNETGSKLFTSWLMDKIKEQ